MISSQKKLLIQVIILIIALISAGTLGYYLIEDLSFFDSLYMTVITISTVGYGEVFPLSVTGRIWSIILILFGVSLVGIIAGKFAEILTDIRIFRRNKMLQKIKDLKNHIIVCGYGRMGQIVCESLQHSGKLFVVIDHDNKVIEELIRENIPAIEGDATLDETIEKANVKDARACVCTLETDADNLFVTFSVRDKNKNALIISRCKEAANTIKLKKAGANRVINPYEVSGKTIAQILLQPAIHNFIEIFRSRDIDLAMEEIEIPEKSFLSDIRLIDAPLRSKYNLMITVIFDKDHNPFFNPSSDHVLKPQDHVLIMGKTDDLNRLKKDLGMSS
jgi:voltage-gated potassium channel